MSLSGEGVAVSQTGAEPLSDWEHSLLHGRQEDHKKDSSDECVRVVEPG